VSGLTFTRGAAASLVAVALLTCARPASQAVRVGLDSLRAPARSLSERELLARPDAIPETYLLLAREQLPPDALFSIAVGDELSELEELMVVRFLPYWLAPRRYTPDLTAADWILTFRRSSETLGVPVADEIGLGPDGNAVRVAR
jgi:hypothetical protein